MYSAIKVEDAASVELRRIEVEARMTSGDLSDDEVSCLVEQLDELDNLIRSSAIDTNGAALAKARSVLRELVEGRRANAAISAAVTMLQLIAWMGAQQG